jgi:hypothetical protein
MLSLRQAWKASRAQGRDQRAGAHEEDARVPAEAAVREQGRRHLGLGLLEKARHRMAVAVGRGGPDLDVAVGRAREGRRHAEGHDAAGARGLDAGAHGVREQLGIGDVMVGRCKEQQLVGPGLQRRHRHRGRGVAPHGLEDLTPADAGGIHRLAHQETMFLRGDAGDLAMQAAQALQRELQQALAAHQRRELLGQCLARQRPQARAAAAAQHDGMDDGSGHGVSDERKGRGREGRRLRAGRCASRSSRPARANAPAASCRCS